MRMARDRKMKGVLAGIFLAAAGPAPACELALALAVDVSGSVSPSEYEIQMRGLAAALRDGLIGEALVQAEAAVMLVQWSGSGRQEVSLPWRRLTSFAEVEALAAEIEAAPRRWRHFSTAIGEALALAASAFAEVPDCKRRVIDVSGDGFSNEGPEPAGLRPLFIAEEITVNALAIEESQSGLSAYFRDNVIAGPSAFVVRANSFEVYPARIRLKLAREVTKQVSALAPGRRGD